MPSSSRSHSLFQPAAQQQVNHVSMDSRHNPIAGSYIINPEMDNPFGKIDEKRYGRLKQKRLDKRNKKMFGNDGAPNAVFHTRHGAISLNLATAGYSNLITKTHVHVASRHGKIHLNLFSLQQYKHITLEASTRHGNIVLFIPPNFDGALMIRSRQGKVNLLPAFSQRARIVQASDDGSLVLFGQSNLSLHDLGQDSVDVALLTTRQGRITVGVSGVDHYDESITVNPLVRKLNSWLAAGMNYIDKQMEATLGAPESVPVASQLEQPPNVHPATPPVR